MIDRETFEEVVRRIACPVCGISFGACVSMKTGKEYASGYSHRRREKLADIVIKLVKDSSKEREDDHP